MCWARQTKTHWWIWILWPTAQNKSTPAWSYHQLDLNLWVKVNEFSMGFSSSWIEYLDSTPYYLLRHKQLMKTRQLGLNKFLIRRQHWGSGQLTILFHICQWFKWSSTISHKLPPAAAGVSMWDKVIDLFPKAQCFALHKLELKKIY